MSGCCLAGPPQTFTISGLVKFGTANNLAGATIAAFDLPTAQNLFKSRALRRHRRPGRPGADKATVQHAIARAPPPGVEVVTGQTVANEQTEQHQPGPRVLLDGAVGVRLHLVVRRRVHDLQHLLDHSSASGPGSWPCCGSSGPAGGRCSARCSSKPPSSGWWRRWSVSGSGCWPRWGSRRCSRDSASPCRRDRSSSKPAPSSPPSLVGVGVTVISAISPARRAVRIPPVAALVDYQGRATESSAAGIVIGSVFAVVGIAALAVGLTKPAIQLVGLGRDRHLRRASGCWHRSWPVRWRARSAARWPRLFGISGKLGRENSMRSPRRTAQTSSALMVGLALVSTIAVFGASLSKSATSSVDNAISADYIITNSGNGGPAGSATRWPRPRPRCRGSPPTSTVYSGEFEFQNSVSTLTAVSDRPSARNDHPADGLAGQALRPWLPASCSSTPRRRTPSTCRWAR